MIVTDGKLWPSAIEQLHLSTRVFHLTGSRFFGGSTLQSDYDFFTQGGDTAEQHLRDLDFTRCQQKQSEVWESGREENYMDMNTLSVWQDVTRKIHVQLVRDVELKLKAQKHLFNSTLMARIPKSERRLLWNLALIMLQSK